MSNSLDLDQAKHIVGPDLDPNCLYWLSADDNSRQRIKKLVERIALGLFIFHEFNPQSHHILSKCYFLPAADSDRAVVSY